ncbi:hypothetical protein N665_0218s0026 [Sinapis alba]|nr:hypothetical protein N665_0218s0026 [Sinapis alba]
MTVNFNEKIDALYINFNTKFETLSTHINKLENQVVQTSEAIGRHESLIKEKEEASHKHHVSALISDDFWQEVEREQLQEGDFRLESAMSFGSSHWCRSTPITEHRSTVPSESVASCDSSTIDQRQEVNNDRRRDKNIDRQQHQCDFHP